MKKPNDPQRKTNERLLLSGDLDEMIHYLDRASRWCLTFRVHKLDEELDAAFDAADDALTEAVHTVRIAKRDRGFAALEIAHPGAGEQRRIDKIKDLLVSMSQQPISAADIDEALNSLMNDKRVNEVQIFYLQVLAAAMSKSGVLTKTETQWGTPRPELVLLGPTRVKAAAASV